MVEQVRPIEIGSKQILTNWERCWYLGSGYLGSGYLGSGIRCCLWWGYIMCRFLWKKTIEWYKSLLVYYIKYSSNYLITYLLNYVVISCGVSSEKNIRIIQEYTLKYSHVLFSRNLWDSDFCTDLNHFWRLKFRNTIHVTYFTNITITTIEQKNPWLSWSSWYRKIHGLPRNLAFLRKIAKL